MQAQTEPPTPTSSDIRRLAAADLKALAALFERIAADPAARQFHPHPFTLEHAARIAGYQGRDVYLGRFAGDEIVGYGMLRGWDEGFEVPSLGIYLQASIRGRHVAGDLMHALHRAAADNGAGQVRLKVYADHQVAVALYRKLGYVFTAEEGGQMVGFLTVAPGTQAAGGHPTDVQPADERSAAASTRSIKQPGKSR